jgi:uncharacterized protein with HEPN domain
MRARDILDCIAKIQKHTRGFDFDRFERDDKTIDAVLRNLEIIGEAARHITPEIRKRYSDLPWKEMQTMRNIVVHEYHGVNLKIIWQTVMEDLPSIVPRLKEILADEEEN